MRILYVGNYRVPWTTETHVTRDARTIPGVTVDRMQEPSEWNAGTAGWLDQLERAADGADLLIYQKTWGLPPQVIDVWRRLEARGTITASYHLDLYMGLEREHAIWNDPFWRTQVVFTADGDPATTEAMRAHGIDHRWMPAGIVSDECRTVAPSASRYGNIDVVFVGSAAAHYHHEWPWRGQLIDALGERYGRRFARLPQYDKAIRGRALNLLYRQVPVVVGDSLALPGHVNYWSDRFYETVGRGGYLIGPNVPGIEQHFVSGDHLDLYDLGDLDHVFELVDQALDARDVGRAIARQGQAHVAAHHTYRHRVAAILESLGLHP